MTCPRCGAQMLDGGQSGFYCPTERCANSWYGTLSEDEWDEANLAPERRERARRMRAAWRSREDPSNGSAAEPRKEEGVEDG